MTNHDTRTASLPALFRAGDIGVSSEWRDITYDWAPVLTADGVFIYSYLRDMFDNQRFLRPFILDPDGPTKQRIQRVLGRRTSWAIEGPEYLLETVGLLHIEVQYGASTDVDRPRHTAAAYYVVGRLDHPVLDWSMLERVLDALMPAFESPAADTTTAARQKDAQAALRSLGQAGMLQNIDPEDLFDPDGAWPTLLPTLIEDDRWTRLFSSLHTVEAVQPYRRQVRAWVEWAQRRAARAMQENRAIGDQLLAAQRRGQRGGGHNSPPAGNGAAQQGASHVNNSGTTAAEGIGVTQTPSVPEVSPACPRGIGVTQTPSGTRVERSQADAIQEQAEDVPNMSLNRQLINLSSKEGKENLPLISGTLSPGRATWVEDTGAVCQLDDIPFVAPHLRDDELTSTRQDTYFWYAVQQILHGDERRYHHTDGEKKAARRLANKTGAPIGVILAALRAVMTLATDMRPHRLSDAFKLDIFHACVQQALSLLPVRAEAAAAAGTWPQFLQAYRSIGQTNQLRDVSTSDYHVLYALFSKQPNECWDVLNRVEHAAQLPDFSPAYLRRAIVNNQREAAQQALLPVEQRVVCSRPVVQPVASEQCLLPDDPRHVLLKQEGVPPEILTDDMTEDYIRQWIAEADARHEEIYSRPGWLKWGIESRYTPLDHPQLRPHSKQSGFALARNHSLVAPSDATPEPTSHVDPALHTLWQAALSILEAALARNEFETWIKPCALVALEPGTISQQATLAVIATPNVFVRQELEGRYLRQVEEAIDTALGCPVQVQPVIGHI